MYDNLTYINSSSLIELKPKRYYIPIITIILLIILFIFSLFKECYDTKKFTSYVICNELCELDIPLGLDEVSKIKDAEYLKLDNKYLKIKSKKISDVLVDKDNNLNYQIISFKVENINIDSLFYEVKVYYNKEIILKKIFKILLESE